MNQDDDPLKPMGVQSADTVQVEAAERAKKAKKQADQATATVEEGAATAGQVLAGAADWFRARTKVGVDMAASFTRERPVDAVLIACAAGALLMGLAMLASKRD